MKLMCQNHIVTFVDSIIPVITKCTPNDQSKNYDLEFAQNDIYEIINEQNEVSENNK